MALREEREDGIYEWCPVCRAWHKVKPDPMDDESIIDENI